MGRTCWKSVGTLAGTVVIWGLLHSPASGAEPSFEVGPDFAGGNALRERVVRGEAAHEQSPATLGLQARLRVALDSGVTFGVRGRAGTSGVFDGHSEAFLGVGPGLVYWTPGGREVELAGEAGLHQISGLAPDWLTTAGADPTIVLPCVGGLLAINGARTRTASMGVAAFFFRDLRREAAHVSWSAFTTQHEADYDVGGWTAGLALRLILGPSPQS
jgi:hypothetical protein